MPHGWRWGFSASSFQGASNDLIFLAVGLGFFAGSIGYVYACDRLSEATMIFDYWLAGIVTAGLLVYLTYALLRPEKF